LLKQRRNPKLGKLDIDYQVLHDAFFKYQKKPKFTQFGDIQRQRERAESVPARPALRRAETGTWHARGFHRFGSSTCSASVGPHPTPFEHSGHQRTYAGRISISRQQSGKGENDPYSLQHRLDGLIENNARHHWGEVEPESEEEPLEDTARFRRCLYQWFPRPHSASLRAFQYAGCHWLRDSHLSAVVRVIIALCVFPMLK